MGSNDSTAHVKFLFPRKWSFFQLNMSHFHRKHFFETFFVLQSPDTSCEPGLFLLLRQKFSQHGALFRGRSKIDNCTSQVHFFQEDEKTPFSCFESISTRKKSFCEKKFFSIIPSEQLTMKNALAALAFVAFANHLAYSLSPGNHCSYGYQHPRFTLLQLTANLVYLFLQLAFQPALLH